MGFEVEVRNVDGQVTALGSAGPHTVVVDRPPEAGGGGRGFSGGELLHLAVAGCVSNDLFREAAARGIALERVVVRVDGGFAGEPARSTGISYDVEISGGADDEALRALVEHVEAVAEIPATLRAGTPVTLAHVAVTAGTRRRPGHAVGRQDDLGRDGG
ncbi:OsmC family protein [Georgenia daeguensis]|uniref:OsmC family protein n=1 Tax=Georgenia daeguensis TaxID=908355 RepID=A0ABP8EX22_9MICO